MTIFVQQSSSQKTQVPTSGSAGPMSIICTGPVIPSVIYHHHMYYLAASGPSHSQNCYIPCPPVSHSLTLPHLMNSLVESVIHTPQGSVFAPRLSVPQISNGYSAPWAFEPSTVKVHSSTFLNQIDAGVSLDRSKLKESSPKSSSASSSCSASSSSYFASLSSPNSSRLSPFSVTSPSSPPSSPSSSPSSTASPISAPESSNSSDSSKSGTDNKSGPNPEQSRTPATLHKKHNKQPPQTSAGPGAQHPSPTLYNSSFTPSVLATPLLSGNASAFVSGAFFGTPAGSLSTQATGALCAPSTVHHTHHQTQPPPLPLRDYYARFGVHYIPAPWNQS